MDKNATSEVTSKRSLAVSRDRRRMHPRIEMVDIRFTITPELKAALKQRSAEEGISTQALVRRVLALEVME